MLYVNWTDFVNDANDYNVFFQVTPNKGLIQQHNVHGGYISSQKLRDPEVSKWDQS